MLSLLSFLFILLVTYLVRILQQRKQTYVLTVEAECGVDIEQEGRVREKMRIRMNVLLGLASLPFSLFPFLFFFLFMNIYIGLELFPVMAFAWGMIYFWFATEQYNVFRESITYEELMTEAERQYFKTAYSPFVSSHEVLKKTDVAQYVIIREHIRELMELESQPVREVADYELERRRTKIDELCWELSQEEKKERAS